MKAISEMRNGAPPTPKTHSLRSADNNTFKTQKENLVTLFKGSSVKTKPSPQICSTTQNAQLFATQPSELYSNITPNMVSAKADN